MASTGATLPTTAVNVDNASGVAWTNPTNVLADDTSFSVLTLTVPSSGDFLITGTYGFAIPTGAPIVGIEATIRHASDGVGGNPYVNITKDGAAPLGTAKFLSVTGIETTDTRGGAADLWGLSFTEAEVEATTFGLLVGGDTDSTLDCQVDYVQLNIFYDVAISDAPETLRLVTSGARWN